MSKIVKLRFRNLYEFNDKYEYGLYEIIEILSSINCNFQKSRIVSSGEIVIHDGDMKSNETPNIAYITTNNKDIKLTVDDLEHLFYKYLRKYKLNKLLE